ncbi:lectin-like protein [Maioricimonas rarisocia]|nr:lectin-like protein [Maioricimonas rarisocia]
MIPRLCAFLLLLSTSARVGLCGQIFGPHQWESSAGGNDHYYALVFTDGPDITWFEARDAAENFSLFGGTGHLVTITSFAESEFLRTSFQDQFAINYHTAPGTNAWIGLTDEKTDGTYEWITGEPFSFSRWASTEPTNTIVNEDYVHLWYRDNDDGAGAVWSWNDSFPQRGIDASQVGFIVEGTQIVPEPSSMALFVCGLGCAAVARRRRKTNEQ